MSATKKIPMRTCMGCRTEKPKTERLRIVKNAAGEIHLDFSGKMAGRGAYVCNSEACVKRICKQKLLHKTFSQQVSEGVYQALEEEFLGGK